MGKIQIVQHSSWLKEHDRQLRIESGAIFLKITLCNIAAPWNEQIFRGEKQYEIRGYKNLKHVNDDVYVVHQKQAFGTVVFGKSQQINFQWIRSRLSTEVYQVLFYSQHSRNVFLTLLQPTVRAKQIC